ncbi:Ribonuclease HII [Metamycoplasma auris 15026]|uniref:Ribonuclease n=1 Tax=Metamycoplasma auris 15026 TaxID=1188233 RepID=N9TTD1_9BACT|nr:ribonuclease HIII [Metamycoplasma auris]ENY69320.1 Ribonuclease HII [Metamycoplasma auris 15026]
MNDFELEYIGVDESGVGDYFSPVVSVACFIPKENIKKLKELGIKDSKKLSDKKIIELIEIIKQNNLAIFKDTTLSQKGYNDLTKLKINNNALKTLIHFNSILRLQKSLKKNLIVVIDQYASKPNLEKHLVTLKEKNLINSSLKLDNFSLVLETKAEEKYLNVACASMMARYILLQKMQQQTKEYNGFPFILGASNATIDLGAKFIKDFGEQKLYNVAKISFKTTKKILEKLKE